VVHLAIGIATQQFRHVLARNREGSTFAHDLLNLGTRYSDDVREVLEDSRRGASRGFFVFLRVGAENVWR
jgi:hypothetical protein